MVDRSGDSYNGLYLVWSTHGFDVGTYEVVTGTGLESAASRLACTHQAATSPTATATAVMSVALLVMIVTPLSALGVHGQLVTVFSLLGNRTSPVGPVIPVTSVPLAAFRALIICVLLIAIPM